MYNFKHRYLIFLHQQKIILHIKIKKKSLKDTQIL